MGVLINCEAKKGVKDYPELKKMVENKLAQLWLPFISCESFAIYFFKEKIILKKSIHSFILVKM